MTLQTDSPPSSSVASYGPRSAVPLARASLAISQLLVGSSVVSARFIVESFPIMLGLVIRQSIATVAMLLIVFLVDRKFPHVPKRDHILAFFQAVTGVVLFNSLLLAGIDRTTAITTGVITSTVPAAIALLSRLLGERITRPTTLGIGLAIAGVMVVNLAGSDTTGEQASAPMLGGILVVGAVLSQASFTILGKSISSHTSVLQNCLLVCIYGTLMLLPFAIWQAPGFSPTEVPASGWLAILWSAGPVMIGGFFLWFAGLRVIPASSAAVFTGLIPVSAIVSSALILGERLGLPQAIGVGLVLAAIFLVTRANRAPNPDPLVAKS